MTRSRWSKLLIIGPYVLVVLLASFGALRFQQQQTEECHHTRDSRTALRALVVRAYSSSTSSGLDLTKVSGFAELDAATQHYLTNLSTAINTNGNRDQAEQAALDTIPPITC